jgi:hypothetical protein
LALLNLYSPGAPISFAADNNEQHTHHALDNFPEKRLHAHRNHDRRGDHRPAGRRCHPQLGEGAKIQGVLDSKKGDNDVPSDGDLFGPDKNLSRKPECPAGGTYNLGTVAEQPKCSITDHALP